MSIDLNNLTEKKPVIKNIKMVFDILLDNGTAELELYGLAYDVDGDQNVSKSGAIVMY